MKAEEVYVDPSGLARLYVHQAGSLEMSAWRGRIGGTLAVTHHGRVEIINAVCRAVYTEYLTQELANEALADLSLDFAQGRLRQVELLWRAALNRAAKLSQTQTPILGTRTLDVLHVACAIELKLRYFLTFDGKQQKLASAVGLKMVAP